MNENRLFTSIDPVDDEWFDFPLFEPGPAVALTIKVRTKNIILILLSLGNNGEIFTGAELDFISTALTQIACAVDTARLIRELKNSYNELKYMQEKLVRFERIEAINQTVVTLNDKINSPLTVIQGHTELIRKRMSGDDINIIHSLDIIEESVNRCSDIM